MSTVQLSVGQQACLVFMHLEYMEQLGHLIFLCMLWVDLNNPVGSHHGHSRVMW